jgi:DNA-binding NtrC family response regulator
MNEKILIVDYEKDIRMNLETLLVKKDYQVRSASRGDEAIRIFKSEPFALVITEVRIPKLNGLGLIRQLKELDENIEIIVLTGSATLDNAVQSMRGNGAFDFLTKPLKNSEKLFSCIEQALSRYRVNIEKKALIDKLK